MTSGVDIVGGLLREDDLVTARVPSAQIKAGRLPDGVALPALLVRSISKIERQPLKKTATVRVAERVSVTVRAASYREQTEVMKLVRDCLRGWLGSLGDAQRASILTAGTGPDLLGPGDSFEQSDDFRVTYDAIT